LRLRAEGDHLIDNALKNLKRHAAVFGANQIGAEIGFIIVSANVAHQTTQIAEIVDTQNNVAGPGKKMTGQQSFVQHAKGADHGAAKLFV
jgi:hypothetical protein